MTNNKINICGQSFDCNSKHFSFEWPFTKINKMIRIFLIYGLVFIASIGFGQDMGVGVLMFRASDKVLTLEHEQRADSIWWDSNSSTFPNSLSGGVDAFEEQKVPSILYFRILEERDGNMLIVHNEKTKQTAWVKNGEDLEKLNWLSFINSFDAVEIGHSTKLKIAPSDSAKEVSQDACGKFYALQLQGDWIEVTSINCEYYGYSEDKKDHGWVKWTNDGRILVNRFRNE